MNYKIIEILKENFPAKLKIINRAPKKLYAIGNINLLYEDSFGIVGSRIVSNYGIECCKYFAKELSLRDIIVVSGMAEGTDTIAHKTTIENSGKTIAVLGSGFNYVFPEENKDLFTKIINNNGLVITEYENNTKPDKRNFPKRNRIISALSEGILVIEAKHRSGTSITAKYSKNQGKKVFAVPGRIDSYLSVGSNNLIKDGAIITTKIEDILNCYPQFANQKRKNNIKKETNILKEYKPIYNILKIEEKNIEEISIILDMSIIDTMNIISIMEIENIIEKKDDGNYRLKTKE